MEELNTIEKVLTEAKREAFNKIYIPDDIKMNYDFKITSDSTIIEKKIIVKPKKK